MPKSEKSKSSDSSKSHNARRNPYEWIYDPFAPTEEERRQEAFDKLVDDAIPAFWMFVLEGPEDIPTLNGVGSEVMLIDLHSRRSKKFLKSGEWGIPEQIVSQGYVPVAPLHAKSAYSFELMVLYEHMRNACRVMDFGHFVQAICKLQSAKFRFSMKKPFERAFESAYTPLVNSFPDAGEKIRAKYPIPPKEELIRIFGEQQMLFYKKSVEDLMQEHLAK